MKLPSGAFDGVSDRMLYSELVAYDE